MSAAALGHVASSAEPRAHGDAAWRLGDQFHTASLAIAGASAFLAAGLGWLGDPRPAFLALVGGVGLGLTIGRVAYALPRALDAPMTGPVNVWAAFALWHGGVSLLAPLAWRELVPPAVGAVAGMMLAASSLLLLDRLARMLLASPRRLSNAWKVGLSFLTPAGVAAVITGVLLAFAFTGTPEGGLTDVALSILVFGSLLPAGAVAVVLHPRVARRD